MIDASSAAGGRLRVAVVFGGRSTEHAISCVSAGGVLAALDRSAFDVVAVGITSEGRWVLAPDDASRLAITDGRLPTVEDSGEPVVLSGDPTNSALIVQPPGRVPTVLGAVDVVFPLLHGPFGEDGTLQGLLELAGVPYVGSGVLSSALAMDKAAAKIMLAAAGLEQAPYVVTSDREWNANQSAALGRIRDSLPLPVFVKPARAGSSVGVAKVTDWQDLHASIERAREHDPKIVVEAAVVGREIECGVLDRMDGSGPEASVCAEITVRGEHEFYDFAAKYLDNEAELTVPADLAAPVAAKVQAAACRAYDALGCEDYARVDFFLTDTGSVVVNEVNTIPGFTPISMFPRMWAASGISYPALVERLVQGALRKRVGLR